MRFIDKISILLIKFFCKLDSPFLISLILIIRLQEIKFINYKKNSKKKILYFRKSIGYDDLIATFDKIKSKYSVFWIPRIYFYHIFHHFLKDKLKYIHDFNYLDVKTENQKLKYRTFLKKIFLHMNNFWGLYGFFSSNFLYAYEREIQNVSKELNFPFVCIHKEGIRSKNQRIVQDWIYSNRIGKYNGSLIVVYNENEKKSLINSKIAKSKQIVVGGCPRLDKFFKIKKSKNEDKILTCFLIQNTYGLPIYKYKWLIPNIYQNKIKPKNFTWKFLNNLYYKQIKKFAQQNKDYKVIIKSKIGFSDQQLRDFGRIPANISIVEGGDSYQLIKKSKIITAFNSTVLLESIAAGKMIFSPEHLLEKKYKNFTIDTKKLTYNINQLTKLKKVSVKIKNRKIYKKRLLNLYLGNAEGKAGMKVAKIINNHLKKYEI